MRPTLRQSAAVLHTWSGLLLGWLLYVMFLCGTIAYFQEEVTRWMQPEAVPARSQLEAVAQAQAWLARHAPGSPSWFITPPDKRAAVTQLYWEAPEGAAPGAPTSAKLDGTGREVIARDTAGGYFLYRMHYDMHYLPVIWARYIVGIAAMFMLMAIVSGIITHKKIFADFFMLRFGKGQRSWLDAHNVTAVLALPFHLMITYTGLVSLASLYAPAPIAAAYQSEDSYYAAAFPLVAGGEATGERAPLAPLDTMVARAAAQFGAHEIGYVSVSHPGDRAASVAITSSPAAGFDTRGTTLRFDGVTGALANEPAARGGAQRTESVMIGLHAGRYAGAALRWLYFVAGLFGTAMVATGLVLWTAKRRARLPDPARPHVGFRLVERLNIAVVAGFPLGLAGYFLANRLLPPAFAQRSDREIAVLFLVWAAAAIWTVARPARQGWREVAGMNAAAFAAIPFIGMVTLGPSWARPDGAALLFVIVDLMMLATAAAFVAIAWYASRPLVKSRRPA